MKYCQGNRCHEYRTKDRIRGTKGQKHYATRRRSDFNYSDNFCSLRCQEDWLDQNIENALDHFGRVTEAKKVMCDQAWYKHSNYSHERGNSHHFLLMIYLVNAYQLLNNNTMTLTSQHLIN